ncbi:C40 family peptidase [Mesoaciditoga lauensis]|uniref:C40 family peptidase n=1 Tax=Mesoaciditoga lauensis TaxID=1495039 RepID=UPI0014775AF2|nr:C40 family peptidase [Mesoaciditoga lauensis]
MDDNYSIIKSIRSALGDKRTCKYELNFEEGVDTLHVIGKVDTRESYQKITELLSTNPRDTKKVDFNVKIMEDDIDDSHKIAIVKSSTCDMKSSPDFRSLSVHQLIFGESAKVLDFSKDYVLAKDTRTGFIGWMRYSNLSFMSEKTFNEWRKDRTAVTLTRRFSLVEFGNDNLYLPIGVKIPAMEREGRWICEFPNGLKVKFKSGDAVPSAKIKVEELAEIWKIFLGTPYLWGGTSTYGIDCSGYVGRLYDYVGIKIPRDSDQQRDFSQTVEESELKIGDLAFFPGHVAFYIGDGKIAHANLHHGMVGISELLHPKSAYEIGLKEHLIKFGRVLK